MVGALTRSSRAPSAPCRLSLSVTERRCTGVPTRKAELTVGSAARSSVVAVSRSRESAAVCSRNGRCTCSDSVPARSVGGLSEIVDLSACGSREIASKVLAMVVKRCALVFETGATMRAASPSSLKKDGSSVRGADRLAMTDPRWPKSWGATWMVWLRSAPRPARASPKPCRLPCDARRVGASNML